MGAAMAFAADASSRVTDPIFGLKYDPASVAFDPAPADLVLTCPDLTNQKWDRKMWVFGKAEDSGSDFLVIGGYYVDRSGKGTQPDTPGAIVRLEGAHCTLIGPARETFDSSPEGISQNQLQKLAADAVCRYAKAYGSRAKFLEALKRQHVVVSSAQSPVLKQAIVDSASCSNKD